MSQHLRRYVPASSAVARPSLNLGFRVHFPLYVNLGSWFVIFLVLEFSIPFDIANSCVYELWHTTRLSATTSLETVSFKYGAFRGAGIPDEPHDYR